MPIILRPHLRYFFHRGGPIGRWSKVDCQATAVGCWRRPDACASRSPTPSDGAPTLVPSDGPVGRATSQPPVSQPTSLSPSRSLSRAHVEARARAPPRPLSPAHIPTYIRTYVRTYKYVLYRAAYTNTHTHIHTRSRRACVQVTRAHMHTAPRSFSLHPTPPNIPPRRATILRGEVSIQRTTREGVRVPGSSLAAAVRSQTSTRQARGGVRTYARTHARNTTDHVQGTRGSSSPVFSPVNSRRTARSTFAASNSVPFNRLETRSASFSSLSPFFSRRTKDTYIYIYIFGTRISIFFASVHRPRSNLARDEEEERVFPRVLFTTLLCCCCCCLCSVRGDPRGSCVRR